MKRLTDEERAMALKSFCMRRGIKIDLEADLTGVVNELLSVVGELIADIDTLKHGFRVAGRDRGWKEELDR